MKSIFIFALNAIIIAVLTIILTIALISIFKKNKTTKCRNCNLKCAYRKNKFGKNSQNNFKQNANNNDN